MKFTAVFGKDKDLKEMDPVKPCEDLEGYTQVKENILTGLLFDHGAYEILKYNV